MSHRYKVDGTYSYYGNIWEDVFGKTKCPNCCFCVKSLRQEIEIRNEKIKELEKENAWLNKELELKELSNQQDSDYLKDLERENAELAELLGIMFDKFEDGDPCYDTPNDPGAVYLGNAVRLEDHTFKRIVDALDRNKVKETNKW